MLVNRWLLQNLGVSGRWKQNLLPPFRLASTAGQILIINCMFLFKGYEKAIEFKRANKGENKKIG